MNEPSAEAIALAVSLSGHTICRKHPCELCRGDAEHIDRELCLPQRNAALLLAQGVVDSVREDGIEDNNDMLDQLAQLRDALALIK